MCRVCNEDSIACNWDNRTVEEYNQDIDRNNMDAIDNYLKWKKEYDEKGYFTAFMGVKIYEEPPEPKLESYK